MPARTRVPAAHVASLDGLRGVAILLVMFAHFTMHSVPASEAQRLFLKVTGAGWCGVDLFFVLSGFLITGILVDDRGSPHYFRNFYMRRVLRILPLYYGVLFVFFVVGPRVYPQGYLDTAVLQGNQAWIWLHGSNFLIARDGWPAADRGWMHLGHFWSLAVEEHFYLLWPALVAWLPRQRLVRVCEALIILPLGLRLSLDTHMARYLLTPCRVDALAVGCWIAVVSREAGGIAALAPIARRVALLVGAALAMFFASTPAFDWQRDERISTTCLSLQALFFGAVLVLAVTASERSLPVGILRGRVLRTAGKFSYGAYVIHLPMLDLTARLFPESVLAARTGSPLAGIVLSSTLSAAVCFAAAAVLWHVWEKHFLALKKYF